MAESYTGTEGASAVLAGLDVMDGNESVKGTNGGWRAINKTRDMIALLAAGIRSIATGGTGAGTAAGARTNLDVPSTGDVAAALAGKANTSHQHASIDSGGNHFTYEGSSVWGTDEALRIGGSTTLNGVLRNPWARANAVGSWINLGVAPDGTIGNTSSSRRFKKNIRDWTPDLQALLAIRLVQFKYRASVYAADDTTQHGVIAEELHDLGLTWLVAYDENGAPFTVHYDRIALGLLSLVQDHEARLTVLEQREA